MNHLCKRSFSLIMAILMVLSLIPASPVHVHAEEASTVAVDGLLMNLQGKSGDSATSELVGNEWTYYDSLVDMSLYVQNTSSTSYKWLVQATPYKVVGEQLVELTSAVELHRGNVSANMATYIDLLKTSGELNDLNSLITSKGNGRYALKVEILDTSLTLVTATTYFFNYTNQSVFVSLAKKSGTEGLVLQHDEDCAMTLSFENKGKPKTVTAKCDVVIGDKSASYNPATNQTLSGAVSIGLKTDKFGNFAEAGDYSITVTVTDSNGIVVGENTFTVTRQATPATKVEVATLSELLAALADETNDLPIVVTDTIVIPEGVTVTLDLNGKTISYNSTKGSADQLILNKGTLTINDSADGGKITFLATNPNGNAIPGYASNTITNAGVLVINGGTIENTTAGTAAYVVDNNSTSANVSLTVNSGVLVQTQTTYSGAIRVLANSDSNTNTVNIKGGEVRGRRAIWIHLPGSNQKKALAELNVTGGTIDSTDASRNLAVYVFSYGDSFSGTTMNFSGGVIDGNIEFKDSIATGENTSTIPVGDALAAFTITNGTFNGEINNATVSNTDGLNLGKPISGGTFTKAPAEDLIADGCELGEDGKVVESAPAVVLNGETVNGTITIATVTGDNLAYVLGRLDVASNFFPLAGGIKIVEIDINRDVVEETTVTIKYNTVIRGNGSVSGTIVVADGAALTVADTVGTDNLAIVDTRGNAIEGENGVYVPTVITYVAEVNGESFESFEDAIAYANTITDGIVNVTLLADVEFGGDDLYADMVLDLNGKTITATGSYVFWFKGGSLVIKDSSAEKTGMIDGSENVGNAFLLMGEESLTIEGGKIHANNNVIYACGTGATVTVNGGELKSVIASGNIFYLVGQTDTITVNGGTFLGNVNPYAAGLTIKGGVFTADVNAYCAAGYGAVLNGDSMYKIIRVDASNAAAQIGDEYYLTLGAAINAATTTDTILVLKDVTEALPTLKGKIVPANGNVTITATNTDWLYLPYAFEIGEGVTLNVPAMFVYTNAGVIKGNVVAEQLYMRYAGTKLTVYEPGSLTVTGESFHIRYMDRDATAGLYIVGDNNDATIGLQADVIYFYQGTISAKDANIQVGVYWQTQETDNEGSANLVLDNTKMNVTVSEQIFKATGNSTVTLTNGSQISAAGGYEGVNISLDETSSFTKNGVSIFAAKVNDVAYTTLTEAFAAAQNGDTVTLISDIELTESIVVSGKTLTLDLGTYTILDKSTVVLTNADDVWGLIELENNSNLTIIGNGTIKCNFTNVAGGWTGMAFAINVDATSALTVDGGNFINGNGGIQTFGTVTVNGGTFVPHNGGTGIMALYADANVTVNNGIFKDSVEESDVYTGSGAVWSGFGATVVINGGTYDFAADPEHHDIVWTLFPAQHVIAGKPDFDTNMTVNGGTFVNFNPATDVVFGFSASGYTFGSVVGEDYIVIENEDGTYGVIAHTHAYTGKITTAPTTTTEGVKTFTCTCGDSYTEPMSVLPEAIVTDKGATTYAGSYYIYDIATGKITSTEGGINLPKTLVFTAKDQGEAAENNYYANYNTDFYVKLEGLSAASVRGTGCYLAGYYEAYELWVVIPLDNVDIQNGLAYPLLAIAGQDFSYEMICNGVKEFTCGLYLSDEFLTANPGVQVTVDLGLREEQIKDLNELPNLEYFQSEGFEYDKEDLDAELVAMVGNIKYYSLEEAVAAAEDGATVTLLADSDEDVELAKAIVLNVNGQTYTGTVTLTDVAATLTAPEYLTVVSAVDSHYVSYENGAHCLAQYVAQIGDVKYKTFEAAWAAAKAGDTISLLADYEANLITVFEGVTLDLNGYTCTSAYVVVFNGGHIVDNSESNAGRLVAGNLMINEKNKQLPVKTESGYAFVNVLGFNERELDGGTKYAFQPLFEEFAHDLLLAGQEATGVSIMVRITWEQDLGTRSQEFVFNDAMVSTFIESYGAKEAGKYGQMFILSLIGAENVTGLTFTTVVRSNTGVEYTSN